MKPTSLASGKQCCNETSASIRECALPLDSLAQGHPPGFTFRPNVFETSEHPPLLTHLDGLTKCYGSEPDHYGFVAK